ncbi:MAG: UDP-glucose/GDP-mannose dehydrogenase family protein [Bacteroidales bacterium]|nr:UDP-glucose/GDP-mannose dehydrogenase family protein [Bacteroidales bacterium]MCF8405611.1 UDP-glucose/GDP-mannose dehydrogenase family protein [Bacteroidales bacterium]
MNIAIIGTGYVGLVTGTCLAETGAIVHCVDIDKQKIENLKEGIIPIYEPGLEPLVKKNVSKNRLFFTTDLKSIINECEAVFIAVGTPPDEDGSADLSHVLAVASDIGKFINDYLLVVTKSTVPIGTAEKVKRAIQKELKARNQDINFDVASNPEFLKEGDAVSDFLKPDRIVIGTETIKAEKILKRLYKPFLLNGHPLIFMNIPSAELTKYTANAMLATKISFINDIANLSEIVGADIDMVRKGIGSDSRIGNKFIYPGAGYGGSCFPKDVKALVNTAKANKYPLRILQAVEDVNQDQKLVLFHKLKDHFNGNLRGKTIGIWGLSFKPGTDDMREAPSLVLIEKILEEGGRVKAYDPVATREAKHILGEIIEYTPDMYEAAMDADALILVTEWSEFRIPNYKILKKLMNQLLIFDGRNIYDPEEMKEFGFTYYSIGRKTVNLKEKTKKQSFSLESIPLNFL